MSSWRPKRSEAAGAVCLAPLRPPPPRSWRLRILLRRRWGRRNRLLARLQLFEDHRNSLVELLVDPGVFLGRVIIDHDVRIDAVTLDDPFIARNVVTGKLGTVQSAAVQERQRAANADDAAPAALADQWPQLQKLEPVGKQVSIGRREFVEQTNHGAGEQMGR